VENEQRVKEMADSKPILTPEKQRVLWARVTAIKTVLIRAGLTTPAEFRQIEDGMVRDINAKVLAAVREDLGLEE
jgi:hypothetical protein